jgi:hypothetical protein
VFFIHKHTQLTREAGSVGIATGYGLDDRRVGVRLPVGSRILSNGYRRSCPGDKAAREADHSPPASAEVKKMWIYTSTPP